jgi:hypothetical protein
MLVYVRRKLSSFLRMWQHGVQIRLEWFILLNRPLAKGTSPLNKAAVSENPLCHTCSNTAVETIHWKERQGGQLFQCETKHVLAHLDGRYYSARLEITHRRVSVRKRTIPEGSWPRVFLAHCNTNCTAGEVEKHKLTLHEKQREEQERIQGPQPRGVGNRT